MTITQERLMGIVGIARAIEEILGAQMRAQAQELLTLAAQAGEPLRMQLQLVARDLAEPRGLIEKERAQLATEELFYKLKGPKNLRERRRKARRKARVEAMEGETDLGVDDLI